MFGILRFLRQDEERWGELDKALESAFGRVRAETRNIYAWIKYLREKDIQNDARQDNASRELGEHKALIKTMQMEIAMLKEEVKNIQRNSAKISPFPDLIRTKSVLKSGLDSKTGFERKILAISRPVKKEYVMQQVINLMEKGICTTKQIETIIVKEKMLCGRTAFYDYLKELKLKNQLPDKSSYNKKFVISEQN